MASIAAIAGEQIMEWTERPLPQHADDLENAPVRCAKPKWAGGNGDYWWPCGKCNLCRFRNARILAHRIDLESRLHSEVAFVTLTYAGEFLPADGNVSQRDMTLFLKRLRQQHAKPLRYYYLAEYGSNGFRPHYHIVLYGFRGCVRGQEGTWNDATGRNPVCCEACKVLARSWHLGRIDNRPFLPGGSAYLANYAVKALGDTAPPANLKREFARWSKRPGLGSGMAPELATATKELTAHPSDAPVAVKYGDDVRPLGRFIRGKVRDNLTLTADDLRLQSQRMTDSIARASQAARSHGTSTPEMGARLSESVAARKRRKKSDG